MCPSTQFITVCFALETTLLFLLRKKRTRGSVFSLGRRRLLAVAPSSQTGEKGGHFRRPEEVSFIKLFSCWVWFMFFPLGKKKNSFSLSYRFQTKALIRKIALRIRSNKTTLTPLSVKSRLIPNQRKLTHTVKIRAVRAPKRELSASKGHKNRKRSQDRSRAI